MRGQKLSKIHFLILLSLLGFISPLQSQEYKFRTLGVEDGLSQITVSDICQDEKSRIWIATLDGLNCFDGNHIKVFNHFHNDSISYGNLYVTQMVEDGQDCSEVLIQLAAVRSALTNTGKVILKDHIDHCIVDAVEEGNLQAIADLERAIDQFMK